MPQFEINDKLMVFAQRELLLSNQHPEAGHIQSSLEHLKRVLKDRLWNDISDVLPFGSYTRGTMLRRKYDERSDVDLLVVFKNYPGKSDTPGVCRKKIRDVLAAAYPDPEVRKDFPTVTLELNHILFDLVPCHIEPNYNFPYRIPGKNDEWQLTNPEDFKIRLNNKNTEIGGNLVRDILLLCKYRNISAGRKLTTYQLENLLLKQTFYEEQFLYDKFLITLRKLADETKDAALKTEVEGIRRAEGSYLIMADYVEILERLKKLLPGLK